MQIHRSFGQAFRINRLEVSLASPLSNFVCSASSLTVIRDADVSLPEESVAFFKHAHLPTFLSCIIQGLRGTNNAIIDRGRYCGRLCTDLRDMDVR